MTLILSAILPDVVVVASDGAEFQHAPGAERQLVIFDRQKLLPIEGQSVVLALHGHNRLHSPFASDGKLLIEFMQEKIPEWFPERLLTMENIVEKLKSKLTPLITSTFATLKSRGIESGAFKIGIFGFDFSSDESKAYEIMWKPIQEGGDIVVVKYPPNPAWFYQGGTGSPSTEMAIKIDPTLNPDSLAGKSEADVIKHVQKLYAFAYQIQDRSKIEFAGKFHCVSVTKSGCRWIDPTKGPCG